ncbi:transmembrane 4 L6 family member 1-like isoform X1 [Heterodontus francisci]|uniref:transmembrane 4 L6 family member 1-like isoform X1 n=1 Tax=Heterodontus francisci TaxID=7792 RepID=UPI00355B3A65
MCPGRCARCVGIALVPLALIAIPASVILLFPNGEREYLTDAHITWVALFLPGLWGSGFMVVLAALSIQAAAADGCCCFCTSLRVKMFVSVIYAQLAIIGSATCFGSSALGLIKGPLCLFNTTLSNKTQVQLWDYPFHDRNRSSSAESYLSDPSLWAICEKPKNIVLWNTVLFCTLMVISCLEVLLCTMQIINGLLGCIFGRC